MSGVRVPGYETMELLGYGAGGEVWLARELATGEPVALKRLRPEADLAARDRLRREAAVLAGVDHPHVVRLRSVVGEQDGEGLVLVLDLAPGGSLARLLATRGRLSVGEVVTVAVPLAQALAVVHAQGLVHGDVTPANVLFTADGRPLLSDLGVARLLGTAPTETFGTSGFLDPAQVAGRDPGPAADVHGLAATCLAALTGAPPYDEDGRRCPSLPGTDPAAVALLEALAPALASEPAVRPSAEDLAVAVFDAAAPEPVQLVVTGLPMAVAATHRVRPVAVPPAAADRAARHGPGPVRPRVRFAVRAEAQARDRARSRVRVAGLLTAGALAAALAVTTGLAWAGADDGPRAAAVRAARSPATVGQAWVGPASAGPASVGPVAASADTAAGAPGWAATLAALDRARARAFAAGDPALLQEVYASGAPALRRDRAVLARLSGAGLHADGLRLRVTAVRVRSRSSGRVRLAVTDVMPAQRLVDATGALVERRPGRGARSWVVVLVRERRRWVVYDVARG